jgi:dipeptidyl aminopeptidase/acylaminoacyl peptidase
VNEQRLRDELRRLRVDEGARGRTLHVVRGAWSEREPVSARRRWAPVLAVAACLLAALVAVGSATAPGDAVARWVREVLGGDRRQDARPALVRVPGGGRLLVASAGGGSAWVVSADGSRRRLGDYAGASWSPHGLYVVAWRGSELRAVEPGGRVRWSLSRPAPITAARWAPVDGFRIAYLTGGSVRVVAGDGTGDRLLAVARAVAPAWRPDDDHVLSYVDRRWRVRVVAVDGGRELWRTRPLRDGVTQLAWSPDGSRLLVAASGSWRLFGRDGLLLARRSLPAGFVADDFAWSLSGRRVALVQRNARRSEVVLVGPRGRSRPLFTGSGRFGGVAFSPDGRRLLVPWPDADQWLFLSTAPGGRIAAVANIGRQFAAGPRPGPFPDAVEWCCSG